MLRNPVMLAVTMIAASMPHSGGGSVLVDSRKQRKHVPSRGEAPIYSDGASSLADLVELARKNRRRRR